jgi:hypothetical protein
MLEKAAASGPCDGGFRGGRRREELAMVACVRRWGKGSHACGGGERKCCWPVFLFRETMLNVERSRPIGLDHCIGPGTGRPKGCAWTDLQNIVQRQMNTNAPILSSEHDMRD